MTSLFPQKSICLSAIETNSSQEACVSQTTSGIILVSDDHQTKLKIMRMRLKREEKGDSIIILPASVRDSNELTLLSADNFTTSLSTFTLLLKKTRWVKLRTKAMIWVDVFVKRDSKNANYVLGELFCGHDNFSVKQREVSSLFDDKKWVLNRKDFVLSSVDFCWEQRVKELNTEWISLHNRLMYLIAWLESREKRWQHLPLMILPLSPSVSLSLKWISSWKYHHKKKSREGCFSFRVKLLIL